MTPEQRSLLEAQIARTDEGLASLPPFRADPADQVSTTWRGLRAPDELLAQLQEGNTFADAGFLSSSTREQVAEALARGAGSGETPVLVTIECQNGVDVTQLSKYVDESEILFPRSSKFEVVSVQPDQNGVMRVVLRQVE